MITIDTAVQAKKQYIIDHVMPSDLDNDVKEGLKIKEEMIANVTAESIRELTPNIDETIQALNDQGISEEKYTKFITGEITQIELYEKPDPSKYKVKYCIDEEDRKEYKEDSTIELKVPTTPDEEGNKQTTIYLQIILDGELSETYFSKNAYWSILPLETDVPPVPDVVKIHYKGIVPTEDDLIDDDDISAINNINNSKIYTDTQVLSELLNSEGLVVSKESLDLWVSLNFIKPSQSVLPNYTVTTKLNDGDFFMCTETKRNHIYYSKNYIKLPKGLSVLNSVDNDTFLTLEKISFNEQNTSENQETKEVTTAKFKSGSSSEDCTGGTYCFTDQLQCKKYESVETDIFVYMHLTATKQQEKKQKSCSKSGNCSKNSSSCDKGKTDSAIKHKPTINEPWLNIILDKLCHLEHDPMGIAINALIQAVFQLCKPDDGGHTPTGAEKAAEFAALALVSCPPRNWQYTTWTIGPGSQTLDPESVMGYLPGCNQAVDIATQLIMDPAESAMNAAIDAAINAFNNIVDSTINTACTAAMNSLVATSALSKRKFKSSSDENRAMSNMNKSALQVSIQLMANFSQQICDVRMMDDGSANALEKVKSAIEVAKQKAQQEAEIQAALVAAQYIKDCQS